MENVKRKFSVMVVLLLSAFCVCTFVIGEPAAAPTPDAGAAVVQKINGWTAALNGLVIPTVVGAVAEIVFRLKATQKPLSWLHLLAGLLQAASGLCSSAAGLLDKVLPQRLKDDEPKQ